MTASNGSTYSSDDQSLDAMSVALLRLVSEVRSLVAQAEPRWRLYLGSDEEGTRRFLRLVQEMLLWPAFRSSPRFPSTPNHSLADAWESHARRALRLRPNQVSLQPRETDVLERIWAGMLELFPHLTESTLLSAYLHFWNPLTSVRATEAVYLHHMVADPLDPDGSDARRLRVAFDLYTALDTRGRRESPPLFTANQLLQRLRGPSAYNIHWGVDADGAPAWNPCGIRIGAEESGRFLAALPPDLDLAELVPMNEVNRQEALKKKADRLFSCFEDLDKERAQHIGRAVERALVVLRRSGSDLVDERWHLNERQAAFFLFGLALNWQTLKCKHLYNFPVSQGSGCSIVTATTGRELRELEYCVAEHLAMAILYPIMQGSFFDAVGRVESNVYRDWRHELETPVNMLYATLERAEQALAAAGSGQAVATAATALSQAKRSFHGIALRVKDRIHAIRDSRTKPPQQTVAIGEKLMEVYEAVREMIGPEEAWFPAAARALTTVRLAVIPCVAVRAIVERFLAAADSDRQFDELRGLLDLYLKPVSQMPVSTSVAIGPLESILHNLCRNALAYCSWDELVLRAPPDFRMLKLTRTTNGSDRCIISVSNPVGTQLANQFERAAGSPPCFYATWWRAVDAAGSYGTWGGRHTLDALRRLRPNQPAEETTRWLVVTSYDPFTVELTLPVE